RGIIGNDRLELCQLADLPASVLRERMRAGTERFQADFFQEIDGSRDSKISSRVARAAPDEFVRPRSRSCRWPAAPTQHRRADAGLMLLRNIQKTGPEGRTEPLVAAGGVEIAAELLDRQFRLSDRMRAVDGNGDAAAASPLADFGDGQD